MNPFSHITSRLSAILRGRKATNPAMAPTVPQTTGHSTNPLPTGAPGGNASGSTHAPRMAAAANRMFAPIEADTDTMGISAIDDPSRILKRQKQSLQDGDTLEIIEHSNVVLTCDGSIVPPDQLKGRCGICGGFVAETPLTRCVQCSRILCAHHALLFTTPDLIAQMLCPICHRISSDNFSGWDRLDSIRRQQNQMKKAQNQESRELVKP